MASTDAQIYSLIQKWKRRLSSLAGELAGLRVEEWMTEEVFLQLLRLERKRSERSGKPFMLMLLDVGVLLQQGRRERILRDISSALSATTRETDIAGWHKEDSSIGVIFTEIGAEKNGNVELIRTKTEDTLRAHLTPALVSQIKVSTFLFPEEWDAQNPLRRTDKTLYADLSKGLQSKRLYHGMKRVLDAIGSVCALILFAPVFLAIAVAIKMTSKGPILFRQERLGQHGAPFHCLKFRTMYEDNDPSIHKEFVTKLIAGKMDEEKEGAVFKITDDPRVTGVGRFLRKTSLDELPQFLNVLKGEMSLVGPRPPVPYELQAYDIWHRCRVLEAKPGITGLWQVEGRSRTTFDEMVRLDLRYVRAQSLWLDLRILLKTPWAVISSKGAY